MNALLRIYPGDEWALLAANMLVQVTVIILAAWLLARVGNRWNAAARHCIYVVALVCVLAGPGLALVMRTGGVTLFSLQTAARDTAAVETVEPAETSITHGSESQPTEASDTTVAVTDFELPVAELVEQTSGQNSLPQSPAEVSLEDMLRSAGGFALAVWLLGMAWLLARWCHGQWLIAGLRRSARPLDSEAIAEQLARVRRILGTDRLPLLAVSNELDRPVMVGLFRPLVILPENVNKNLSGRDLADVLVHECAHAVCRHQLIGFVQRLAGMLFWPHPLVHLLNRELARAREEVCDNFVLCHGDATRYARTLLDLSQSLGDVSLKPAALGLFFHCPWRLEDRVADLLDRRRRAMTRVNRITTAVLTAMFVLVTVLIAGTRIGQAEPASEEKTISPPASAEAPSKSETNKTDSVLSNPELLRSAGNLYDIMSAIHMYHDVAERYPTAGYGWGYDKKEKKWFRHRPNLSWRVQLLPLLGERELFEKFRSGEPWDSERNKKLIPLMPKIYHAPGSKAAAGKTNYLGIVGPGTAFPNKGTIAVPDFTDGTSNTIMLVEVTDKAAVEWTKPEDFPLDTKEPLKTLMGLRENGFLTAFADGSPRFVSGDLAPEKLRAIMIRNDETIPRLLGIQQKVRELTLAVRKSRSQTPAPSAEEKIKRRAVNKRVRDYSEKADLSTPESAMAAWSRSAANTDIKALNDMSWVKLDAELTRAAEQDLKNAAIDNKNLKQQILDTEIVEVFTYRDDLAVVICKGDTFPNNRPYAGQLFGRIEGKWKNIDWRNRKGGHPASIASAAKLFDMTKAAHWEYFTKTRDEIKKGGTPTFEDKTWLAHSLSAAEKKDMDRKRSHAWHVSIDLDMPNLKRPAVQFALFDKDPVPGYIKRLKQNQNRRTLNKASNDIRKEFIRTIQMTWSWDLCFMDVRGNQVSLLMERFDGSDSVGASMSIGRSTQTSGNELTSVPVPIKKRWIVTKTARDKKGKPVCWCIPVEMKAGVKTKITLNESNTFDLKAAYDEAIKEEKETTP